MASQRDRIDGRGGPGRGRPGRQAPPALARPDSRREGETRCDVCGTELSGLVTLCNLCETPHHAECWTYNSGCAVYGCQSHSSAETLEWDELRARETPLLVVANEPIAPSPPPLSRLQLFAPGVNAMLMAALVLISVNVTAQLGNRMLDLMFPARNTRVSPPLAAVPRVPLGDNDRQLLYRADALRWADLPGRTALPTAADAARSAEARSELLDDLEFSSPVPTRCEAALRLGRSGVEALAPDLTRRLDREQDATVRAALALGLHLLGDPRGSGHLAGWMRRRADATRGDSRAPFVRAQAIRAGQILAQHGRGLARELLPQIEAQLDDEDPVVRIWACRNLAAVGDDGSADRLANLVAADRPVVAYEASLALVELGASRYRDEIEHRLRECDGFDGARLDALLAQMDRR